MIALRDYQIPAVSALASTRRGVLKAPAGSGKTVVGAAALRKWSAIRSKIASRKLKVCWVAHSHEQIEQAKKAIAAFPTLQDQIDPTFVCYQAGHPLAGFDLAIFDECHHIPYDLAKRLQLVCLIQSKDPHEFIAQSVHEHLRAEEEYHRLPVASPPCCGQDEETDTDGFDELHFN